MQAPARHAHKKLSRQMRSNNMPKRFLKLYGPWEINLHDSDTTPPLCDLLVYGL